MLALSAEPVRELGGFKKRRFQRHCQYGAMPVLESGEEELIIRDRPGKGAVSFRVLSAVAALGILNGCVTSYVGNPEIVKQNNAKLTGYDQGLLSDPEAAARDDQLRRLWRDKPEYVGLVGRKHTKPVRIVSIAAPKYPYWEAWARSRADVSVSFIVGIDGKVEDARVYESSDSRFEKPALERTHARY